MSRLLLPHVLVPISLRCRRQGPQAPAQPTTHAMGPRGPGRALGAGSGPAVARRPKVGRGGCGSEGQGERRQPPTVHPKWLGDRSPPGGWTNRGLTQRPTTDGSSEVVGVWGGASGGSAGRRPHIAPQRLNHKRSANVVGGLRCDRRSRRQVR